MTGRARTIVAGLLVIVGAIWLLQGLGVLGGSAMSGSSTWAWIGGLCIVASAVLFARSGRGPS